MFKGMRALNKYGSRSSVVKYERLAICAAREALTSFPNIGQKTVTQDRIMIACASGNAIYPYLFDVCVAVCCLVCTTGDAHCVSQEDMADKHFRPKSSKLLGPGKRSLDTTFYDIGTRMSAEPWLGHLSAFRSCKATMHSSQALLTRGSMCGGRAHSSQFHHKSWHITRILTRYQNPKPRWPNGGLFD